MTWIDKTITEVEVLCEGGREFVAERVSVYQSLVLLLPIVMNDDHEVITFGSDCFQTLNVGFVVEDPRAGGHYERLSSLNQLKHRTCADEVKCCVRLK